MIKKLTKKGNVASFQKPLVVIENVNRNHFTDHCELNVADCTPNLQSKKSRDLSGGKNPQSYQNNHGTIISSAQLKLECNR